MIINTEFDNPLEEDIVLEETDETLSFKNVLRNSENMLKSVMYLKKLFTMSPTFNRVVKVSTIDATSDTAIVPDPETNVILVKNITDSNFELYLNGGQLILLPFETFDFPIDGIDTISCIGNGSIIETKYTTG